MARKPITTDDIKWLSSRANLRAVYVLLVICVGFSSWLLSKYVDQPSTQGDLVLGIIYAASAVLAVAFMPRLARRAREADEARRRRDSEEQST